MPPDVVVETPSPEAAAVNAEAATAVAEARAEETQTMADASVEQTRIAQEQETAREEIRADAAVEIAGAVKREEIEACLRSCETNLTQIAALAQQVQSILQVLETLRPPSPPALPDSGRTESPGASEQAPPPEPQRKKSAVRWT